MALNSNIPPINLDESVTHQYMLYDPNTRRSAISETTRYSGTGTFVVADNIPYRDVVNTLREPQTYTPVWFGNADYTGADVSSIVLGNRKGDAVTTGLNSVAITPNGGLMNQAEGTVAIGFNAGQNSQGTGSVAIGTSAGNTGQGINSVAVGTDAGNVGQNDYSVAIGYIAGNINQGPRSVAVGYEAGTYNQGFGSIAIGPSYVENATAAAGHTGQGQLCIAIGSGAGSIEQGGNSIGIGFLAGEVRQTSECVAVGNGAGRYDQGTGSIAIGYHTGYNNAGTDSVYLGSGAGKNTAGTSSFDNVIVVSARGVAAELNPTVPDACFIAPIRNESSMTGANPLYYNTATSELTWDAKAYFFWSDATGFPEPARDYAIPLSDVRNYLWSQRTVTYPATYTLTSGHIAEIPTGYRIDKAGNYRIDLTFRVKITGYVQLWINGTVKIAMSNVETDASPRHPLRWVGPMASGDVVDFNCQSLLMDQPTPVIPPFDQLGLIEMEISIEQV